MTTRAHSNAEGRWGRLRSTLLLMPIISLMGGLLLGLRSVLAAGADARFEQNVILGALLVLILTLVVGAIHIFKIWIIHWRTVLATMYLTSGVSAIVYAVVEPETLRWLVVGISDVALADTRLRLLIGGLDGLFYGSVLGLYVTLLDPRATRFTRAGILRYLVLYVLHAVGLGLITAANLAGGVLSRMTIILLFGLMVALKFGVQWWDKHHPESAHPLDGAPHPLSRA